MKRQTNCLRFIIIYTTSTNKVAGETQGLEHESRTKTYLFLNNDYLGSKDICYPNKGSILRNDNKFMIEMILTKCFPFLPASKHFAEIIDVDYFKNRNLDSIRKQMFSTHPQAFMK